MTKHIPPTPVSKSTTLLRTCIAAFGIFLILIFLNFTMYRAPSPSDNEAVAVLLPTVTPSPAPTITPVHIPKRTSTPDPVGMYRTRLQSWWLRTKPWLNDFVALLNSGTYGTPAWSASIDELVKTGSTLRDEINATEAPAQYHNGHEMMKLLIQSCTEAMSSVRDGESYDSSLRIKACTIGVTLTGDKLKSEGGF